MTNVKDKIRKLLAMAEAAGGNENEMKNAMAMASDLMMRHGVEREQLGDVTPKARRGEVIDADYVWYHDLAVAAGLLCGCKTIHWYPRAYSKVRFVGRPENIEGAQDIYTFLILQLEMFYKAALPKGMSKLERAEYRKTFKHACALRIRNRAQTIIDAQPKETGTALMVIDHRNMLLGEAAAEMSDIPDGKARKRPHGRGTSDGRMAGDAADLNRKAEPQLKRIAS